MGFDPHTRSDTRGRLKNKYGIPQDQLAAIRQRDQNCVYCHVEMPDWKDRTNNNHFATVEHVYPPGNDPTWVFFCCNACNASHRMPPREWFKTDYCIKLGITEHTVAEPVKRFLASGLKEYDLIWFSGLDHEFLMSAIWSPACAQPHEYLSRDLLSPRGQKRFDSAVKSIQRRFKEMRPFGEVEDYGTYYGFAYWVDGECLCRERLTSTGD